MQANKTAIDALSHSKRASFATQERPKRKTREPQTKRQTKPLRASKSEKCATKHALLPDRNSQERPGKTLKNDAICKDFLLILTLPDSRFFPQENIFSPFHAFIFPKIHTFAAQNKNLTTNYGRLSRGQFRNHSVRILQQDLLILRLKNPWRLSK